MKKTHVAILGSTGSIGTQTLDIIRAHHDRFVAEILVANNNAELLIRQAIEFQPNTVIIVNEQKYGFVCDALAKYPIKVFTKTESAEQTICGENVDIVVAAIVGYAGLKPVISAIKSKKTIALANKETLVVAGNLIMHLAKHYHAQIIPVDSEHSAIFQSILGEPNAIEKILLTASGGPFFNINSKFIENVTKTDALKHPRWTMGKKITIDSATMMNKGFEVIEARWLFDVKPEQIQIVVHPQSIVHSMVQFADGSVKAQLSEPDMRIAIAYALNFPLRLPLDVKRIDFSKFMRLEFQSSDTKKFPCITLAYEALDKGGNMACIMNAANEIAVDAFLTDKIKFLQIPEIIEKTMNTTTFIKNPDINDYMTTDIEARKTAKKLLNYKNK
ncbi:MAG: 1-deoxy-D-xylulose-5-phosphate reductoisomerase [Prevotellaceae bacterium]|jgi:1-deoxy-D-xylulose-5-phosphate reductoisomerase|nr:1-deoxy-D-xylulose-5-phosphate reductoisomerase [Prevotellaceae bacterium]